MPTPNIASPSSRRLSVIFSRLTDRRAVKNVRWTLTGNTTYAASQWAMIVVLARWTNPQTVGTLALALAITAPVMLFFNMQMRAVIATDVKGRYGLQEYFQTRLLTTAAALALILACCALYHQNASTVTVVILIALAKATESLSDIIHGYWQLVEHMEVVGKSLTTRAFLTLGIFLLATIATRSLIWGAAALLTGSIGVFLAYDMRQVKRWAMATGEPLGNFRAFFDLRTTRKATLVALIRRSFPLGAAAMLISLNATIPRYFIEIYSGKHQLGIFSALSYFIVVGNLLTNAVGQSVLPRLAALYTPNTRTQFKQTLAGLLTCSVAVGAASMTTAFLFGRRLLLIYGKEYADAYTTFLIIMAAASISYSSAIVNFSLNAVGAYDIQMPLFLVVTLVLTALCRVCIPGYGITGAAVALLISSGLQAALSATVLVLKTRPPSTQTPCPASS